MGLFDRFREGAGAQRPQRQAGMPDDDDAAIARYRYMLRTAPPETIEQAHAEAFAKLTPEQRRRVLEALRDSTPAAERPALERAGDSPGELARMATRAEIREPGALERMFGRIQPTGMAGPSMGAVFGGTLLSSMAGTVLGSMIAQHFFNTHPDALHQFGAFPDGGGHDLSDRVSSTLADSQQHDPLGDVGGTNGSDLGASDFDGGADFGDTFDV